ncbi:hypothetical protein K9U40_00185 [Xanthobacter autotrophicus]|uniref:hypothetical protein n=1 Tax=Xanthobacter TaxID=279 RepID=UPI0024AA5314|nr:hypothetical protein [Xanthobacter autotrophicus]MDI4662761.1 hypothetical protein [Xanthobacter autotrophicus]
MTKSSIGTTNAGFTANLDEAMLFGFDRLLGARDAEAAGVALNKRAETPPSDAITNVAGIAFNKRGEGPVQKPAQSRDNQS